MTYEAKLEWRNAACIMRKTEQFRRFKSLDHSIKKQFYSDDQLQTALNKRNGLLRSLVMTHSIGHDSVDLDTMVITVLDDTME